MAALRALAAAHNVHYEVSTRRPSQGDVLATAGYDIELPLSELGSWRAGTEDQTIHHRQLQRVAYVMGEMAGRPPIETILDMRADQVRDRPEPFVDMQSKPRPLRSRSMARQGGGIPWQVPQGVTVRWWDEGENAVTDWALGVRVSWPLFDGGRRKGQIEAARAQLEQSRQARQQLQLRIDREVRTAMADLESAESRVTSLRNTVAESERVLHDERLRFDAGRSVINFVLDAESALLTNQSLLSQARRSVSIAALALDLSLGRIDVSRLPR